MENEKWIGDGKKTGDVNCQMAPEQGEGRTSAEVVTVVLERMHITLQCWVVLERVSVLNHFPQSVPVFPFHASEGRESTLT
jgi:hypothetical protein